MNKATPDEVVAQLKDAIRRTSVDPPSIKLQTIWILRHLLDQIEHAPDNVGFGVLTVDFRTGDFNLDSLITLEKPLTRFVGTYSVDNPFFESAPESKED